MITFEARMEFGNRRLYVVEGFDAFYTLTGRRTVDDTLIGALRALGVAVQEATRD